MQNFILTSLIVLASLSLGGCASDGFNHHRHRDPAKRGHHDWDSHNGNNDRNHHGY